METIEGLAEAIDCEFGEDKGKYSRLHEFSKKYHDIFPQNIIEQAARGYLALITGDVTIDPTIGIVQHLRPGEIVTFNEPIEGKQLLDSLHNAKALCQAIVDAYPNPDINHVDFRVQVTKWAQDFLDDDAKSITSEDGGV